MKHMNKIQTELTLNFVGHIYTQYFKTVNTKLQCTRLDESDAESESYSLIVANYKIISSNPVLFKGPAHYGAV